MRRRIESGLVLSLNNDRGSSGVEDIVQYASINISTLLRLLPLRSLLISRLTVQPNPHKCDPACHCHPDPRYPCPARTYLPAPRVLVVRKMSHRHLTLNIDAGEEWPLVVDAERKDAMLVWRSEGGAE